MTLATYLGLKCTFYEWRCRCFTEFICTDNLASLMLSMPVNMDLFCFPENHFFFFHFFQTEFDICAAGLHNCDQHAHCISRRGTFKCQCLAGFKPNGLKCVDIDECAERRDACHGNARCVNTVGSYKCTCPPGHARIGIKGIGSICV